MRPLEELQQGVAALRADVARRAPPDIDPLDPARLDALQQAVDELVEMGLATKVEVADDPPPPIDPPPPPIDPPPPNIDPPPPDIDPLMAAMDAAWNAFSSAENATCELIADALRDFDMRDWDADDIDRLAEHIGSWVSWDKYPLAYAIVEYEPSLVLFATDESVLSCGIRRMNAGFRTWAEVETEFAPQIDADRKVRETEQRHAEIQRIIARKLPRVRKLKEMHNRIDRLMELDAKFGDKWQREIAYIRECVAILAGSPSATRSRAASQSSMNWSMTPNEDVAGPHPLRARGPVSNPSATAERRCSRRRTRRRA